MLTPLEFERRYHEVRVSYFNDHGFAASCIVDVYRYLMTGRTLGQTEQKAKDELQGLVSGELDRARGLPLIEVDRSHQLSIARAFFGKGSPDDYAITLKHALRYKRTRPELLQKYCDKWFGLDCVAFVNNYFYALGRLVYVAENEKRVEDYGKGVLLNAVSEIRPEDVVVWPNNSHIALVATAPDNNGQAVVVESSNSQKRLMNSRYTFARADRNLFSIQRYGMSDRVKVARVP